MDAIKIKQLSKLTKAFFNCMKIDGVMIPDDNRDPLSNDHPCIIKMNNVFDCMGFNLEISDALTGEEFEYLNDLIKNDLAKFIKKVFIPIIDSPNFLTAIEKKLADLK